MTELSPQAQAVLDAIYGIKDPMGEDGAVLAAAFRAAADRVRRGPEHWEGSYPNDYEKGWNEAVDYFTTIANELENPQ